MKNLIIFLFSLFLSNFYSSQVTMKWEYSVIEKKATVYIYNNNAEDIILPVDLTSLKPYFENQCSIDDYENSYPILGATLVVENKQGKMIGNIHNNEISDDDHFNIMIKEIKKNDSIYLNTLKKWSKKNKIHDRYFMERNYYLSNHLVVIKSKDHINFKVSINFDNITNQKNIYYYYPINWAEKNEGALSICVDPSIYHYLTKKQKQKLSAYKLFTGRIESNKVLL
ncbi:hypothetical protein [Chryseobacterium sp. JK1]|uniref:hypothetical protein n=1 Tax=Chryseobacterium sp. JK1 TaxID=874294 RepID=UPI003D68BA45